MTTIEQTTPHGVKALRDVLETMADSPARAEWMTMLDGLPATAGGTLKTWAQSRHGATLKTYQWRVKDDGRPFGTWAPGPRVLDSRTRKGAMILDGSHRDYAGERVVAADDSAILIVSDGWDGAQYCAYVNTTNQFCDSCEDLTATTKTVVDGDTLNLCANCI